MFSSTPPSLIHRFLLVDDVMDTLVSLRVFVTVAEMRSFSGAAARLGMSVAMVSKHVMHLEGRISARLLNRTSRSVSMTEAGRLYLAHACQAIEGIDQADAEIRNAALEPSGTLRVSAPVWMANPMFANALADYRRKYPKVQIDIDLSDGMVNIVDEAFDLVLRATSTPDPGLITRVLTEIEFRLVASPAYIAATALPAKLSDLEGHDLLAYTDMSLTGPMTWKSLGKKHSVAFRVVLRSGNESLLREAALAGMGFAFLPEHLIQGDLRRGTLVAVLPKQAVIEVPLHAAYASSRFLSAKVRTFIDHFARRGALKMPERVS